MMFSTPVSAQLQTGSLFGSVIDPQGASLPGATVTLSGGGAPQVQTTDEEGRFRFPGLAPGEYDLEAHLDGHSPVEYESLLVSVGRNLEVQITLAPAVRDTLSALNSSYVLLRANVLGTGTGDWVTETLGPRTFRVGARLSLR